MEKKYLMEICFYLYLGMNENDTELIEFYEREALSVATNMMLNAYEYNKIKNFFKNRYLKNKDKEFFKFVSDDVNKIENSKYNNFKDILRSL